MHPSNDDLVKSLLVQIGFDVKKDILYEVAKHRDLQGNIAVGVIACGEYSTDVRYKQFLDVTERIVVASMVDVSLGREMSNLLGKKATYRSAEDNWNDGSRAKPNDPRFFSDEELLALGYSEPEDEEDEFAGEYIERDWEETLRAIKQLESVRDDLRGVK
jgi:hypothetical protein